MIKTIEVDFDIKDVVYLTTRKERIPGKVVQLIVDVQGVMYRVCWSDDLSSTQHYSFELSKKFVKNWKDEAQNENELDDE